MSSLERIRTARGYLDSLYSKLGAFPSLEVYRPKTSSTTKLLGEKLMRHVGDCVFLLHAQTEEDLLLFRCAERFTSLLAEIDHIPYLIRINSNFISKLENINEQRTIYKSILAIFKNPLKSEEIASKKIESYIAKILRKLDTIIDAKKEDLPDEIGFIRDRITSCTSDLGRESLEDQLNILELIRHVEIVATELYIHPEKWPSSKNLLIEYAASLPRLSHLDEKPEVAQEN